LEEQDVKHELHKLNKKNSHVVKANEQRVKEKEVQSAMQAERDLNTRIETYKKVRRQNMQVEAQEKAEEEENLKAHSKIA